MNIQKLDLFGSKYTFTVFGKKDYKTNHGAVLTILSVLIIGLITFLFGRDFFYKLNPKIFSKSEISALDKFHVLENSKFSYMWILEDRKTDPVVGEDIIFYPKLAYRKWEKNSENQWAVTKLIFPKPKKCKDSTNALNPNIQNFNLDNWSCIDWDEVSEKLGEPAKLGGQWDGDVLYNMRVDFQTCYFDHDKGETDLTRCSTPEKVEEVLSRMDQYFSFNIPMVQIDSTDYYNPFKVSYKYNYLVANTSIAVRKYFYFGHETIFDDRGWVLESIVERKAVTFISQEILNSAIKEGDYSSSKNKQFFSVINYFTKEEQITFRSYIKAQELFANIGGILKFILFSLGWFSRFIADKMREIDLLSTFQKQEIKMKSSGVTQNQSEARIKAESPSYELPSKYFFKILWKTVKCASNSKTKVSDQRIAQLISSVDVVNLIKANTKNSETAANRINFANRPYN